jgi:nucleoside-diphosphate-sugar epimerase
MRFTVLGATGFIGSHLLSHLQGLGHECLAPERGNPLVFSQDLGHVIYSIGLTSDFRTRPFDTVRAHVCYLADILERAAFESLLYLSSTRSYGHSAKAEEDVPLLADPQNPGDLYNLTKTTGESLCFASGRPNARAVRLSNVYGGDFASDNFLFSVLRDAVQRKRVVLHTTLDSAKDYVSIDDVVKLLPAIAQSGRHRLYNVASGINVSNRELLAEIRRLTGCELEVSDQARTISFPKVSIERVRQEFDYSPALVLDDLQQLFARYTNAHRDC